MNPRVKNAIYTGVLLLLMFIVWKIRQGNDQPMIAFSGKTMGPIVYNIKYFDHQKRNLQKEVDSVLVAFNKSLSTYDPNSEISTFNRGTSFEFSLPYFLPVLEASKKVYDITDGAYDPTITPLINTWGFGTQKEIVKDSSVIDSLKQLVGFEKINFDNKKVVKRSPEVTLDFSASAKGSGVDAVVELLEKLGIENLLVEIGGEVSARGINVQTGEPWKLGILDPNSDQLNQFFISLVSLKNKAMATSGNYFNYHIVDGVKYSHTISPYTGYPIVHSLLSASVFADNCLEADAMATAMMVLGYEKSVTLLEQNPDYDAFLVITDDQGNLSTYATEGIQPFLIDVK